MKPVIRRRHGCVTAFLVVAGLFMTSMVYFAIDRVFEQSTVSNLRALCVDTNDLHEVFDVARGAGTEIRAYPTANVVQFWRTSNHFDLAWLCSFVRAKQPVQWQVDEARSWAGHPGYVVPVVVGLDDVLDEFLIPE